MTAGVVYDDFATLKNTIDVRSRIASEVIIPTLESLDIRSELCSSSQIRIEMGSYNGMNVAMSIACINWKSEDGSLRCDIDLVTGPTTFNSGTIVKIIDLGYADTYITHSMDELIGEIDRVSQVIGCITTVNNLQIGIRTLMSRITTLGRRK